MNKSMIAICFALIFSLLASVGIANEWRLDSDSSMMNSGKNLVDGDGNGASKSVERAGLVEVNPDLPFLSQHNQKGCLDSCQMKHDTCMQSANSANSKYLCDDNRWRCTRTCDNKWYHRLQL